MQWILVTAENPPDWFIQAVKKYISPLKGMFAAQLLWQRGIQNLEKLTTFLNYQVYQPTSPFELGAEMSAAVKRLQQAWEIGEKVAIWGDFDADGITATSVLWDGLGEFFQQNSQLIYFIPNRLRESHGLNQTGIADLAAQGCRLIVTCDTGCTNTKEIIYAQGLGLDVIVTDHHTLPSDRPPAIAIINPRYLPEEHPLFNLSGVAVAYKLVEALYQTFPDIPKQPLTDLLDLVAVGLIADLVQLKGDCRYLAQLGIQRLQDDYKQPVTARRRPGIGKLLEFCQKTGDRPTDISFGLGPRINAVSRIHGDARFCVELLTSRNIPRCHELAAATELANTRRKSLQKDVQAQVVQKLAQLDLSTTSVIVLEDPQWAVGVLGLVAGQIAQETGRPTILLSSEFPLARGSARSINSVDLYQLVKEQAYLLTGFGGHPFAAGLSLLVENIPLFTDAINQKLRQSLAGRNLTPTIQADLVVTVKDLGKDLFLELKLLEPCGMGNPVPKLLIKNCWFTKSCHRNQQDFQGKKVQYIKTEFEIIDDSSEDTFPGVWWGHYQEELPEGRCDCIVELDFNSYKNRHEIRLIAVRSQNHGELTTATLKSALILDWRNQYDPAAKLPESMLILEDCPLQWGDLRGWVGRSLDHQQKLALAWSTPENPSAKEIWVTLVGMAKYLSRTQKIFRRSQLLEKLDISTQTLDLGLKALKDLGFTITGGDKALKISWDTANETIPDEAIGQFLAAAYEEKFQQIYFTEVPLSTIVGSLGIS
jgi:single-stranded-DNA-specific exonuclease